MMTYFWYILGATFTMRSTSAPSRNMITSLSVYVCKWYPGMTNMATSRPAFTYTDAFMNNDSIAIFLAFWRPCMHVLLCIHCAFFINISNATTSTFFINLVASTKKNVSRMCNCVRSFMTYAYPCYLNCLKPVFSTYCLMMMWIMWHYRSSMVIFSITSSVFVFICLLSLVLPIGGD